MMYRRKFHYYLQRVYIGFSLLFLLGLFIYFEIFKQSNIDDLNTDQPEYCNKTIISKHYMDNKR
jgi:putative Mn2+ efflux pump MntP